MEILQPNLRFPEFTDSWESKKLIELSINGFSNGVFNDPKKVGSGYKIINVKDMYSEYYINTENLTLLALDEKEFLKNKVNYGDIFFTRSSLVKEGIAHSKVNLSTDDDITYDGHLIRMRPNNLISNSLFLGYNFSTNTIRNQFILRGKTTTMTTIGQEDIATVDVFLPSLNEQTKIANFISQVDEKLTLLKEKKTLLEDYKKGLMQKIFNQEIRFKNDNGKDFKDWQYSVISSVFNISTGKSKSNFIEKDGKYIIVDMGGISSNCKLIAKKYTNYNKDLLNIGDLIMPKDDIGVGLIIGKTVVINENDKYILGDHVYKLVLKDSTYNPIFFSYYINSDKINIELRRKTNGTAQISLNKDAIYEQSIFIPEIIEQTKIANFLSAIDEKIDFVSNQIQDTLEYKKGLLQLMFV